MQEKRILFVGLGDLGTQILDLLLRIPGKCTFLIGGRNEQYLQERTNLSVLAATQLGFYPDVTCTSMDLWNIDQIAHTISRFQPDIIFCAATLLPWRAIGVLPRPFSDKLYTAQMGPWLPVHLALVYRLMLAVKQTGLDIKVINASYPGLVNPVLKTVNLAPVVGVGELANNVPALRKSVALRLGKPLETTEIYLFMQRYLSHRISRVGNSGGAPFHLSALVNGENVTHLLDMEKVFELLPTKFKRAGGTPGQIMTAASAAVVFEGMVNTTGVITHGPGPDGLPGGYPVRVHEQGVDVVLPAGLSIEEAVRVNEECQKFDGIEKIDQDGTVHFMEREMSILRQMLGYECKQMPLAETEDRARELLAKYAQFAKRVIG